ncbi:MAG TPA: hypothetical protein VHO49_01365, partial [Anaerolineales bacterium]|nr:hypothetical protein [Anaerolineales bacterium]
MGLVEIAASFAAALLTGALTRGALRTYLLLALSVLAVYRFQPALSLRFFDFWLPSLTLAFVILTWFLTSRPESWKARQNALALVIIVGITTFIELSRYVLPDPLFTENAPPPFLQYLVFAILLGIIVLSFSWLTRGQPWIIAAAIFLAILVLVILKTPALSLQTSILVRILTN